MNNKNWKERYLVLQFLKNRDRKNQEQEHDRESLPERGGGLDIIKMTNREQDRQENGRVDKTLLILILWKAGTI